MAQALTFVSTVLAPDDPLCALAEKLLREDPRTANLDVQRDE